MGIYWEVLEEQLASNSPKLCGSIILSGTCTLPDVTCHFLRMQYSKYIHPWQGILGQSRFLRHLNHLGIITVRYFCLFCNFLLAKTVLMGWAYIRFTLLASYQNMNFKQSSPLWFNCTVNCIFWHEFNMYRNRMVSRQLYGMPHNCMACHTRFSITTQKYWEDTKINT